MASDLRIEFNAAPHRRPRRLLVEHQAVYALFVGDTCLKVGKAGPKSGARFVSQHYGFKARSTLAKSLLVQRERVAVLVAGGPRAEVAGLTEENVARWIEANSSRVNVFLPSAAGPFALSLLEAFMQCRFKPIFEGSTA